MGASLSSNKELAYSTLTEASTRPRGTTLGDVPESCVSSILIHMDPPEICKLAMLNRTFHGASLPDFVWETKLPSNYMFLVKNVLQESIDDHDGVDPNHMRLSKREIYLRLVQPNFFDGRTKQIWLDKNSGKIFISMSYKALRITGIDDRRYWNHISSDDSRFEMIAYLQQIWWFEVVGELEFEFPPGAYSVFFRIQLGKTSKKFGRRICNGYQVHGWDIKPVRFHLSTSDGQRASSECYLQDQGKWVHYYCGDFVVKNLSSQMKIKVSMMQIDCTHTKGGVCFDSVLICPSEFKEKINLM